MNRDSRLVDIAVAVSDGSPLDWDRLESSAESADRDLVRWLRVVERIASVHATQAPLAAFEHSLHDSLRHPSFVSESPEGVPPARWGALTIERRIGGGAYADVYLARDPRLDRPVALKLLRRRDHAEVAESETIDEARMLARVRHPNVVTVHGADRIDGRVGIWMEYVEGVTLEEELRARGPFSADEVAEIGSALCRALGAVHDAALLHRDVKAQNVMRGRDGRILLTDFGAGREAAQTIGGELAGTPVYLAPEVLSGMPASIASDIYGAGVLLYHLATRSFPVTGRSLPDLRDAHARGALTPVGQLRPDLPSQISTAIDRACDPTAARRYGSAAAFATELEKHKSGSTVSPAPVTKRAVPLLTILATAGVAVTAFVGVPMVLARHSLPPIVLGEQTRVTSDAGLEIDGTLSPDGRRVAYSAGTPGHMHVLVRQISGGPATSVTDKSVGDERRPRWSPDGMHLLFTVGDTLYSSTVSGGGRPIVVARAGFIRSAAWTRNGEDIFFIAGDSLFRVSANGGIPVAVRQLDADAYALAVSPDGSSIAYATGNPDFDIGVTQFGNIAPSAIRIASIQGGAPRQITHDGQLNTSPVWAADGRSLLFISNRDGRLDIFTVRVDVNAGTERAQRLTTGLDAHDIDMSPNGAALAYSLFSRRANVWSIAIPETGTASLNEAVQLTSGNQTIEEVAISTDRRWLYFGSDLYGNTDIFRMPLEGGQPQRLTRDPSDEFINDPSPDGREIAFHKFQNGRREVFVMPAEGGFATFVAVGLGALWSPDGSRLLVEDRGHNMSNPPSGHSIVTRRSNGEWGSPRPVGDRCQHAEWSHDGRGLLAVCAGAVQMLSLDGALLRTLYVPRAASHDPVPSICRSPDGRVIYCKSYEDDGTAAFWSIPADGGAPRVVARLADPLRATSRTDFATDGRKLYITIDDRESDVWVVAVGNGR